MPLARFDAPFEHPDWIFEPKLDGFRAVAHVEGGACRARSYGEGALAVTVDGLDRSGSLTPSSCPMPPFSELGVQHDLFLIGVVKIGRCSEDRIGSVTQVLPGGKRFRQYN
jgi:hypothetical protein